MGGIAFEQVRQGHWLMAACCVLYLLWWAIFFWPKVGGGSAHGPLRVVGIAAILGAVVCGLLGASRVCGGAARLVPAWAPWGFALGSAALYFVLLAVMYCFT